MSNDIRDQHEFDDAFRRWADRPTDTSAAGAARAIVARLTATEGKRRARWLLSPARATLVAAVIVLVVGTASFIRTLPRLLPTPAAGNAVLPASVPARDADVLLWLDEGTPVSVFLPDGN